MQVTPRDTLLTDIQREPDLEMSRQLVIVVRLRLDASWRLRHGELVDVHETSRGRFAGWDDLMPAIRAFVAEERAIAIAAGN